MVFHVVAYEAYLRVSGAQEERDIANNNTGPEPCCRHPGSLLDTYRRGPAAGARRGPRDTLRSVSHMTALRHNHNSGDLDVVGVPGATHPLDDNCNPPPAVDSSQCGDLAAGSAGVEGGEGGELCGESTEDLASSDEGMWPKL